MIPADIQDFSPLQNNNSQQGGRWFFTITVPSEEDVGKLLDDRKDNILRWLCYYKTVEDQKFLPYLQG
jgi:hypothetical protein